MRVKLSLFFLSALISVDSLAIPFEQARELISNHDAITSHKARRAQRQAMAEAQGRWQDPKLVLAARNLPSQDLSWQKTPMSGLELGLSQVVPLTRRLGALQEAYSDLAAADGFRADHERRRLMRELWLVLIHQRRISEEQKIVRDNLAWMESTIKVSQQLYGFGKGSQHSILEFQVRKSALQASLSNLGFAEQEWRAKLAYLVGSPQPIDANTIPWQLLERGAEGEDSKLLAMEAVARGEGKRARSASLQRVPDLSVGVIYRKRLFDDNAGDFVAATLSLPLPVSGRTSLEALAAQQKKTAVEGELEDYRQVRSSELKRLSYRISKIKAEIEIITSKSIQFAMSSRTITTKSYSLGNISHTELLQSELNLQKLLIKRVRLKAELAEARLAYQFLKGVRLGG